MTIYDQLLEVQRHDTHLDQLDHQRRGLPERQQIAEAKQVLATVDARIEDQKSIVDEARRNQRRIEDELATQEARANQIDAKLYGGTVSAMRELQDLQAELETVRNHISSIEDSGFEALERLEAAQASHDELVQMRSQVVDTQERAALQLTAAEAEIDSQADEIRAARAALVADVPDDVVAEYERLRRNAGGVGIARLHGGRCEGCNLSLSAVELDRIRKLEPDVAAHCEECGRLLVH